MRRKVVAQGADVHVLSIQSQHMNPQFAKNDFAGGFVAGLSQIEAAIAPIVTLGATGVSKTAPTTWLYVSFGSVFVLVVGGGLTLWLVLSARKSRNEARLQAKNAKSEASAGVAAMSRPLLTLGEAIDGLEGRVDEGEIVALRHDLTTLEDAKSRISARYQHATNEVVDPEVDTFKKSDYEHAAKVYRMIVGTLNDQFEESRKELDGKVKKLVKAMASVGTELTALATSAAETETTINGASQSGFRVEGFLTRLTSAKAEVERARTLVNERKFTDANDLIQQVKGNLYQIRTAPRWGI